MSRIHPEALAFAGAADAYERARPSYPAEAIDWLVERAGLATGRTVVDVGAGTGKLTRLLVGSGARVVAVEPIAEMRERLVAAAPGVEALDGTAEGLPLPDASADAITVATAFHWFDHDRALPELHRVIRPGGVLVIVWNMRDVSDPLQERLERMLRAHRGEGHRSDSSRWRDALVRTPLFGEPEEQHFAYVQQFTTADLVDRVVSTSYVAGLDPPERETLLDEVRALVVGVEEPFPFPYVTEVQVIPRIGDRDTPGEA